MSDISMRILLSAVGGQQVLSAIGQIGSALGGGGAGLGAAIAGVGVAAVGLAVGLGVKAVQAAGDFQSQLTALSTGAGESASNLKMVGDGILNMAVSTGTSTKQLTDGMYMIESAGFHGANGLQVLKAAAEGAKVGNADLGTVANGVTTILTDYHMSASQASAATSGLVQTVADGKTHMQDLSSAMGSVLPLASSLGISFPQVAGGIAVMTNAGMSAQHASQNLANAIRSLAAPGNTAQKSMQAVGLSAQQLKDTLSSQGLTGAIKLVEQHVNSSFPAGSVKAVTAFKNIMGGATGYNVALQLGGKNMKTFESNVNDIGGAMNKSKGDVQGWSQVQQNLNFKVAQGQEMMETLGIKVGQILLPYVTKLLDKVIPMVSKFGDWLIKSGALKNGMDTLVSTLKNMVSIGSNIVNFFQHNQAAMVGLKIVVIALAGAIGGIMVASLLAMATAAWAAITPLLPFIAIGALVALAIVGIVLAVKNWGAIAHWIQGVWAAFLGWLKGVFGPIGAWFSGIFTGAWNGIKSAWGSAGAFFQGIWKGIQNAFGNTGQWFQDRFKQAQQGMKSGWDNVTGFIHGVGQKIGNTFQDAANNVVKAHQWMMEHNYYYHNAVIAIQNWTNQAKAWLSNAWNSVVTFISTQWSRLTGFASAEWNKLTGTIRMLVAAAIVWLQGQWEAASTFISSKWTWLSGLASSIWSDIYNTVSSLVSRAVQFLQDQWGRLAGFAQNAWQNVSTVFSNAWGTYIAGPLNNLKGQVTGFFSNMAAQALQWGANIINSIAQGINNAAGAVGNAAANVAGKIHDLLGFHSPAKEGPGSDADKWMPNLINMLSHDLIMNSPQLGLAAQYAAQALATPLATGFRADPYTRADQLSFSTPSLIYSGASKPKETSAVKKEEAEDKKEAKKAAEEKKREEKKAAEERKKEERKAAAEEKKHVHADIKEIKAELHIHSTNAKLTKEQINEIVDQAMHQFGRKIGDEIRAQFGNV